MKKFIILICCLVLVLGTVACTPNDTLIDDSNQQQQQEQDTEFDPLEQVNDPYAQVDVGEGTGIGSLEGEKWDTLQDGAKPLEVGESYTERWSTEPYAMRLRPYEVQFGKDEPAGASFEFLENGQSYASTVESHVKDNYPSSKDDVIYPFIKPEESPSIGSIDKDTVNGIDTSCGATYGANLVKELVQYALNDALGGK